MKPYEIRAALILAQVPMKELGKCLGVSPQHVGNVISGRRKTPRIRAAVAEAIGKQVSEIWPDSNVTGGATPSPLR